MLYFNNKLNLFITIVLQYAFNLHSTVGGGQFDPQEYGGVYSLLSNLEQNLNQFEINFSDQDVLRKYSLK
jgi:hypothetical protein